MFISLHNFQNFFIFRYNRSLDESVNSNLNNVASDRLGNLNEISLRGDNNNINKDDGDGDVTKKIEACINLGMNQNRFSF